jgi:hypothetical protein
VTIAGDQAHTIAVALHAQPVTVVLDLVEPVGTVGDLGSAGLFVKATLSLRYGEVDVTRRIRVPACQMILAVLDHALHADNT